MIATGDCTRFGVNSGLDDSMLATGWCGVHGPRVSRCSSAGAACFAPILAVVVSNQGTWAVLGLDGLNESLLECWLLEYVFVCVAPVCSVQTALECVRAYYALLSTCSVWTTV